MKNFTLKIMAVAALTAAMVLPASAQQAGNVYAVVAGSSALYNTVSAAFFETATSGSLSGVNLCGPHHWTYKSSGASSGNTFVGIHDDRLSSIQDEPGTITISWNNAEVASPQGSNPRVCAYISVDSTVGVRSAFARDASGNPAASILISSSLGNGTTAGQNKIPNTSIADEPLPAQVYTDINGAKITIAGADIRPEDAKFATTRALLSQSSKVSQTALSGVNGLGYTDSASPNPLGNPIAPVGYPIWSAKGSVAGGTAAKANPVDFSLYGSDPISGGAAATTFVAYNVGAGPILVFVNTSNSGSYHLGDSNLSNITSAVLSKVVDGTFVRTRDLFQVSSGNSLPVVPFTVYLREPLSGTYNTFEFNVPNTWRYFTSQEKNVVHVTPNDNSSSDNPLNQATTIATGSISYRKRAVGTGEMVSQVLATPDSLGYAFWGYGNFASVSSGSVARYLTVDGVDPLYSGPSANPSGTGIIPIGTQNPTTKVWTYPSLTFPNVVSGAYPIWTIFRLVTTNPSTDNPEVQNIVTIAQSDAASYYDFIPATNLQVFRSHFYSANIGGSNGHVPFSGGHAGDSGVVYYPEQGGDMGGMPFPIQADYDYINDGIANTGQVHELVNLHM